MEYFVFAVGTCVSIGQVFYRIRGGTVDLSDVAELRADFLDSQYNTGQRILVHITQLYAAVPALFALDDAQEKRVRVKRLAVFLAVTSVGGFTSGGRGWVIAPVLMYLFPYLCAIDGKESWRKAAYAIWQFRYILVLMVGLFSAMLFLRGKGSEKVEERVREQNTLPWYQRDLGVQPFLTYFGTPTCAISAYSDYVEPWAPAYGGMSLGWFSSNLTKIGVYKIAYADAYLVDARNYVRDSVDYRISSTHATIVPRLLTDVGRGGIMWAMAGLMLVCELIYVRLRNRGFILHLIASGCVQFGGFWVNQDLMLFSGGIVLPIFWAYIFMKAFRKELRGSMPIASRAIQLATPRSRR